MRIVYVEDNDANLTLVRKVLETIEGITVEGIPSAEEALPLLQQTCPDVLLLDLDLPGMSGLDLARALRAEPGLQTVPIIAISASVMKDERAKAIQAGCNAFLEKPFDIQRLRDIVRAAADGTLD